MRYLAIGDIHGYADVLQRLLKAVAVRPDDLIIPLGDYCDRGPDTRGVIDTLLKLQRREQLVALRGNHDFMMVEARDRPAGDGSWLMYGGRETLESYGDGLHDGTLDDVPEAHWDFLENHLVDWYEIDTHFFVHAQANPHLPLDEQPTYLLHWEGLYEAPDQHLSGKIMVCGHTRQRSWGLPRNWGSAVCIDTWVYGDGWLTCLDVKSGHIWQANSRGELREGRLPEPETEDRGGT